METTIQKLYKDMFGVEAPWIKCKKDGVRQIAIPFAGTGTKGAGEGKGPWDRRDLVLQAA
jgi:hypothetical protein